MARLRGATQLEYLIVVGLVALTAAAGFRVFGRVLRSRIVELAACLPSLECDRPQSSASQGGDGAADLRAAALSSGSRKPKAFAGMPREAATRSEQAGVSAGTDQVAAPKPARMPGDGLPKATAEIVNRLWLDPTLPISDGTPRIQGLADHLEGYDRRYDFVRNYYDDTFKRSQAADAEHFYLAANIASMLPVIGPVGATAMAIGWDGMVQPALRLGMAAALRTPPKTAAEQILNDWRQVYIDLAGVWWGTWRRPDPVQH